MRILIKRKAGHSGKIGFGSHSLSNYGFTLTEMIVTLAVITVVLGTTAAGVVEWQRHSIYNRNNEYAQSLFIAAQAALAYEEAAGRLDEIGGYVRNGGEGSGHAGEHDEERTLYYLDIAMHEFDSLETNGNRLYRLLRNYVYDREIFHAAIRLEFDPEDGMVYALSYTDRADHFEYSNAEGTDGSVMGIDAALRRDEKRRKDRMMGYQDSSLPPAIPPVSDRKPAVGDVRLYEGETLELRFTLSPEHRLFWEKYTYHIELYDDTDNVKAAFSVGIDELKDTDGDPRTRHRAALATTLYDGRGNPFVLKEPAATEVTVSENGEIRILLDGVDIQAAQILDGLLRKATTGKNPLAAADYLDTYSLIKYCGYEADGETYGLETDTRQIYAKVSASLDGYSGKPRLSNKVSPFAGQVMEEEDRNVFLIQNARHLFNIRFLEVYYEKSAEPAARCYEQAADIRWGGEDGLIVHRGLFHSAPDGKRTGDTGTVEPAETFVDGKGKQLGANAEYAPFPAIPFLGKDSSYTAASGAGGNYRIVSLTLREEAEADVTDAVTVRNRALGLFRVNQGSVERLSLLDIRVDGRNFVGAVCGFNEGILREIEVKRSEEEKQEASGGRGYVNGFDYVGGIAGADGTAGEREQARARLMESYVDLVNESDLYGRTYVGGIIGASGIGSREDEKGLGIERCVNSGRLDTSRDYPKNGSTFNKYHYFGGITGYKSGGYIKDCVVSVGELSAATVKLPSFLDKEDYPCDYVGGIVGYCVGNTDIIGCRTEGGVLQGRYYIGGIVGLWDGGGVLDGCGAYNRITLMGVKYVGGITGASARSADGKILAEPALEIEIRNWENQGIALAMDGCSGGVSGYNTGRIIDCGNATELSESDLPKVLKLGRQWRSIVHANSWGGVAGYNNGVITGTAVHQVYSIVSGEDCVGGIIGYNDTEGVFDSRYYRLEGGYMQGSAFVGGAIGYNTSAALFGNSAEEAKEKPVWAGPDKISGKCFVGGVIGGNMVAADENKSLYLACGTDNPSGVVTGLIEDNYAGGVYVGGYIGYNRLIGRGAGSEGLRKEMDRLASEARTRWYGSEAKRAVEAIIKAVRGGSLLASAGTGETAAAMYILDAQDGAGADIEDGSPGGDPAAGVKGRDGGITAGASKEEGNRGNRLGEVSGGMYIGGIVGYNDEESRLFLRNNTNQAKVYSIDWKEGTERTCLKKNADGTYTAAALQFTESGWKSDGETVYYSYTGGVIGFAGKGVTVENCRALGEVSQADIVTYRGILTEINEGVVTDCTAGDSGNENSVYVGGLVGRNNSSGRIWNCTLEGTVTARAAGGGLAAENYGFIGSADGVTLPCRITGGVCVSETAAGGAAAVNLGIIRGCILSGSVEGTASHTGGIAGLSFGPVEMTETQGVPHVRGSGCVGGLIGTLRNPVSGAKLTFGNREEAVICTASVAAKRGTEETAGGVGGLIGYIDREEGDGSLEIVNCEMAGSVTGGAGIRGAGGLVGGCKAAGSESLRISDCRNRGTVEGYGGAGGIVGYVEACGGYVRIEGCENHGRTICRDDNRYAAGILSSAGDNGTEGEGSGPCVFITDCANTGTLEGRKGAGIYGIHEAAAGAEISDCRNYGDGAGGADEMVSGILGDTAQADILIRNCYGVGKQENPVSSVEEGRLSPGSGYNFYFVQDSGSSEKDVRMAAAFTPYDSLSPIERAVDYSPQTRFSAGSGANGKTAALTLTFRNPDGTQAAIHSNGIQITWYEPREYRFKLLVRYDGEDTYTQLRNENGGEEWSMMGTAVTEADGKEVCAVSLPAADNAQVTADFTKSPGYIKDKAISAIRIESLRSEDDGQTGAFSIWDIHVIGLREPPETDGRTAEKDVGQPLEVLPAEGKWKAAAPLSGQVWIPLLNENPCGGGDAEALYEAVDGQLSNSGTPAGLPPPEPVDVTSVNSKLRRVSWKAVEGAYFYRINIELFEDEAGKVRDTALGGSVTVPYATECELPAEPAWAGKYMKVSVQAVSAFTDGGREMDLDSGWVSGALSRWDRESLPTPEISVLEKEEETGPDGIVSDSRYELSWDSGEGVGSYDVRITDLRGKEYLMTIALPRKAGEACEVQWQGKKVAGGQTTATQIDFFPGEGENGEDTYGFELPAEAGAGTETGRYRLRLRLETGSGNAEKAGYTFRLLLPDISRLIREDSDIEYSYLFTAGVTVQAKASEGSFHTESGIRAWARVLKLSEQKKPPEYWLVEGDKGEKLREMIERADSGGIYGLYILDGEEALPKEWKNGEDAENTDKLPGGSEIPEESESELLPDETASGETDEAVGGQETEGPPGGDETEGTSGGSETEEISGGDETEGSPGGDGTEGTLGGNETDEASGGESTEGTLGWNETEGAPGGDGTEGTLGWNETEGKNGETL